MKKINTKYIYMSAGSDASNLGYGNIAPFSNVDGRYVNVDNSHNPATFSSNQIPGLPGLSGAKSNIDAAAGYVPGICFKGGAKKLKRKIKNITKKYKMKNKKNLKSIKKTLKKKYVNKTAKMRSANNINRMLAIARVGGKSKKKISNTRVHPRNMSAMLAIARAGGKSTDIMNQNIEEIARAGGSKSKYDAGVVPLPLLALARSRARSRALTGGKLQKGGYTPPGLPGIPYPTGYSQYQNNLPMTPSYSVGGQLSSNNLALANPPPIKVLSNCTNCVDNYNHNTNQGFPSRGN